MNAEMSYWTGAKYVKIRKCVATIKFKVLSSVARYARSACGIQLTRGKCPVIYSGCYQKYLGNR